MMKKHSVYVPGIPKAWQKHERGATLEKIMAVHFLN